MATTEERLDEARAEVARLELELRARLYTREGLAEDLHGLMCRHNHTDGCSWHYERDWNDPTRARWLKKADRLIDAHDGSVEDARRWLEVLKEVS